MIKYIHHLVTLRQVRFLCWVCGVYLDQGVQPRASESFLWNCFFIHSATKREDQKPPLPSTMKSLSVSSFWRGSLAVPKMHSSVSLTNMITLQEQGSSRLNIAQRAAQDTTSDVVFEGRRPLFQEGDETDLSRNRVLRFISFCSTSTILVSVLGEENRRDGTIRKTETRRRLEKWRETKRR